MFGVLETCECGREFLRGIYPQKKCHVCDAINTSIELNGKPAEVEEKEEEGKDD